MIRRSSAGLLALLVLARGAAAQVGEPQAGAARAPAMPSAPAMPQVPAVNAGGGDDVVATPFGPMSRSSAASVSSVSSAPVASPRPKAPAPAAGAASRSGDKTSSSKTPASKPTTTAPAEAPSAPAPEPAAVIVAPAPPPAIAPAASGSPDPARLWLREKPKAQEAAPKDEPRTSPWRALVALLAVAGLGGFAFVARQRRGKTQALPPGASRIVVLSTAKIGPKANAVVAEVAGRVYLLGVTDSQVSRLAVLEGGQPRAVSSRSQASKAKAASRHELQNDLSIGIEADDARAALLEARRAPVETADADEAPRPLASGSGERPLSSKFGEMLDRALGVRSPAGVPDFRGNPAVAALLAADVDDVLDVTVAPRKPDALAASRPAARTITAEVLEEQVAGLTRKRRRA